MFLFLVNSNNLYNYKFIIITVYLKYRTLNIRTKIRMTSNVKFKLTKKLCCTIFVK